MMMHHLPFRNQYIITNKNNISSKYGFEKAKIFGYNIFTSRTLEKCYSKNNEVKILIIGYTINPFKPKLTNNEIAEHLAKYCDSKEKLFSEVGKLSGRFVILYGNKDEKIITGDATHFRRIYYGFENNETTFTSSPKLYLDFFDFELKMNSRKKEFINSPIYKNKQFEHAWFGEQSPDDRLTKLLPNHYINFTTNKIHRIPLNIPQNITYDKSLDFGAQILEGTFEALVFRNYRIMQPITAGWDSRLLLSASRKFKNNIQYYIFDRDTQTDEQDLLISDKLANTLNLNFKKIKVPELRDNFIDNFKKNHILPRIIPTTRNIQWFYDNFEEDERSNLININGNVAEFLRCCFCNNEGRSSAEAFSVFTRYPDSAYIQTEFKTWLKGARKFAEKYNISELDLFYWEQFMSNKGAQVRAEMDMAIEEITPFNNKMLLNILYSTGYLYRKKPNHLLFIDLMKRMWPEVLTEPFNPDSSKIKKWIKQQYWSRYLFQKIYLKWLTYKLK